MFGSMEKPIKQTGEIHKVIKYKSSPVAYGTGLVSLDIIVSSDPEVPCYNWAGGTCGNVLTILNYLGWKSYPIARLNGDAASIRVKADMERWGVDLNFAEQSPTTNTPIITQENITNKQGKPVHKFHWKNCPKCGAWLPNYKAVTLAATKMIKDEIASGTLFFFDRTSPGAIDLAKHFKSLGAIIFFEPSAKPDVKHLKQALELADIVKYSNEKFLSSLTDIKGFTSAFLEIQTLGNKGLRYRTHSSNNLNRKWKKMPAFQTSAFKDACGCGDWTSAGLISKLCNRKAINLMDTSEDIVIEAIRYGQALAAWNCGFEGARGGMYQVSESTFKKDIQQIIKIGIIRKKNRTKRLETEIINSEFCLCNNH
ncbi:MAG: carbohydrate kinase [Gammaproteobacteria bacterium]|nr:MAG: carbohydrate kinase [Gammaproteobacteria bacterium]